MKTITINGTVRKNTGKRESKSLRYEGLVPCVLYGRKEQLHFSAIESEFKAVINTNTLCTALIKVDGKEYHALLQDAQYHPSSEILLHVDFLEVSPENKVIANIPVKVTGHSPGILQGGRLNLKLRKVKVKALPQHLPEFIEINVDSLELGKSIRISDLKLENVEILIPSVIPVVSVKIPRIVEEETTVAAPTAEATEAAVDGAPAEGAEPVAKEEGEKEKGKEEKKEKKEKKEK